MQYAANSPYSITQATTPKMPNPTTRGGYATSELWRSDQPFGSELRALNAGQGYPPMVQQNIPGVEYRSITPTPSPAAPPLQPPAPLSSIGSVAGPQVVLTPPVQGPAVPAPVTVGQVF